MKVLHKIQSKLHWFTFPLAIGLVYIVVTKVGWQIFFQALHNFSPFIWILTICCTFLELYVQLLRSWVMLKVDIPGLTFKTVAKAGLAAFSAGSFTPGRVGDGALILLIPGATARAVGIALVDRMMFWPPMHMLGTIALGILFYPSFGINIVWLSIIIAVGYFIVMEIVFHITRTHHETHSSKKFIRELYMGFTSLPRKTYRLGLLLGFAQYFVILIQFQIGLVAIGRDVSFMQAGIMFGSLQLLRSFFAFTPGNLGISEVVGMKLGEFAGMAPDTLPMVTFPFFLTNTVIPALIGFPLWVSMSRNLKNQHKHD